MLKKLLFIIVFLTIWFIASKYSFAADQLQTQWRVGSLQSNLSQGITKYLNLETAAADAFLKKAIEIEPDNPSGYAFKAMFHLFSYEMCFTLDQREKEKEAILYYSEEALAWGAKRIAKHPKDSQAHLAMALAKIAKVHWAIKEKRYLVMVRETSNIWNYLALAKSADPYNYDIDFLMGLLHYHMDHLPGMTRFLSSLLITSGDRQKGLQEMQTAAQKGNLLRDIAQAEVASAYLYFEKQPSQALPILRDLKKRFPNNFTFAFVLGFALAEINRFDEAMAIAAEIEQNIRTGQQPYVPQLQPRYYQLMGRILFKQGEYEKATAFFQQALQDKSFYNARTQARSLLYLGMISDIRQERKQAENYYIRAKKVEGSDGIVRIEANEYLKTPYSVNVKQGKEK